MVSKKKKKDSQESPLYTINQEKKGKLIKERSKKKERERESRLHPGQWLKNRVPLYNEKKPLPLHPLPFFSMRTIHKIVDCASSAAKKTPRSCIILFFFRPAHPRASITHRNITSQYPHLFSFLLEHKNQVFLFTVMGASICFFPPCVLFERYMMKIAFACVITDREMMQPHLQVQSRGYHNDFKICNTSL